MQDINRSPKELKTERDCSHKELFCPFWRLSVWRNNPIKRWWKISAHSDFKPWPRTPNTHRITPYHVSSGGQESKCHVDVSQRKNKELAKTNLKTTGSPSSKYEHRRASTLLRNIQNIWICVGKKNIVSDLRKWKDFNKKQLTLLKMCDKSLLCGLRADLWPFYGFLSI